MTKVLLEKSSDTAWSIVLNDPSNLNAMDEEMAREFQKLASQICQEKKLPRAIILTGAGRAFSAGGDLAMLLSKTKLSDQENRDKMLEFYNSFLSLRKIPVPIIAALNGHAIGAGLVVASACDIRIAAPGIKLGFTFTKLGLHPGMGATYFLPRLLGPSQASELLLTGRLIDADAACKMGLVSSVEQDVLSAAGRLIEEISLTGPLCTQQLLESLRSEPLSLEESLDREAAFQAKNYASKEFIEGVHAVRDKRKPNF